MKISKIKQAIKIAHGADDAVHMIGPHGIGKSEIVKEFANENGFHCEILQLPILEVSDLIGMPDITETQYGKVTTWAAPEWVQRVKEANGAGQSCVVFLDELGRASIDIRQASLQLVLEKRVNEHFFDDVVFVVADNPSDEYDTADFDMALEDRFQTYDVNADIGDWLKYARKASVLDVVRDYLAEYPEKLHFTPETDGEKGSSPRAWKKLSDSLKVNTDDDFTFSLIRSKVGKTLGTNFFHFYNNYIKVVKVEDIVKLIGKSDIATEAGQRKTAKKLQKITKDIEVISAQELANKLLDKVGKVGNETILTYLASLNLEVAASILKTWKESKEESESKFYLGGFIQAQPNKWFIRELTSTVKH